MSRFLMRILQVVEMVKSEGPRHFFRQIIYFNRKLMVVEKVLSEVVDNRSVLQENSVQLVDITSDSLTEKAYVFTHRNRFQKASYYLKKGYKGHGLLKDGKIVGDIWYVSNEDSSYGLFNNDLDWLGIRLDQKEVYSFDIFVDQDIRGSGYSYALQNQSMLALKEKGFSKAYAYYWSDNLPAVWNTRVINKWKEVRMLKKSRIINFKISIADNHPVVERSTKEQTSV